MRRVLSRFVPEHVVDELLERTDNDLRLGGSRQVGTAIFTDIRGFTAFTGAAGSRRVIELLNEYFGEVIDAILAHRGTLVGYRGDGVLAVFGPRSRSPTTPTAPSRRRGRCSTCACRASTAGCAIAASAMASGWGSASTAGRSYRQRRLGSARRLEHTVHGDTVDTASRLEG